MFVQEKTKTQSSDSKKSQPLYTHFKALKESSIDLSSFGTSTITSLVIIIAFYIWSSLLASSPSSCSKKQNGIWSKSPISCKTTQKQPLGHNTNAIIIIRSSSHGLTHHLTHIWLILISLYLRPPATRTSRIQWSYTFKLDNYLEYIPCHSTMIGF